MDDALTCNARDIGRELDWFADVLEARLAGYFRAAEPRPSPSDIPPPEPGDSPFGEFARALAAPERLVLALALIPHVRPQLLDVLWARNEATERGFSEFGGLHGSAHGGFIPTGETAAFLVAGDDLAQRFRMGVLFEEDHVFAREGVLRLAVPSGHEPGLSGALSLSPEALARFTVGGGRRPSFGTDFPARRIHTERPWTDLVLPASTLEQLDEVKAWLTHGPTLLGEWGMRARLRPGFTSLFHGPPGTGKTLSACLLGRQCGCEVYRIDLSMVVSKYIGETEKNLARVFDLAESRRWILFFDEADALFGRRTRVESSHDRYANQEVSFLLQRIEEFDGVVILASNLKGNIDEAFVRRFHSVIGFPMPRPAERRRIWEKAFPERAELGPGVDLGMLAEKHELSGGTIMNVVRYSSLRALSRGGSTILLADVEEGIRREFLKEGRTA
jgi:hypothetical protein